MAVRIRVPRLNFMDNYWLAIAENLKGYTLWGMSCIGILSAILYFCYQLTFWGLLGQIITLCTIVLVLLFAFRSVFVPIGPTHHLTPSRLISLYCRSSRQAMVLLEAQRRAYAEAPAEQKVAIVRETVEDLSQGNLLGYVLSWLVLRFVALLVVLIISYTSLALVLQTANQDAAFVKNRSSTQDQHLFATSGSALQTYVNHVYFTTVTLVTLGYGDITPNERVSESRPYTIAGVLCFVFVVGLAFPSAVAARSTVDRLGSGPNLTQAVQSYFDNPL